MSNDKVLIDYWASVCRQLDETSNETFSRLGIMNEMAISLKEYQSNVEDLRFQIAENWCLCKWCQLFDPTNKDFNHWKKELKAFIRKLKFIEIKNRISKKKALDRIWIDKCDMNKPSMILDIITDKFNNENIIDATQRQIVSKSFANQIDGLINCISSKAITPDIYIQTTFKA